MDLLKQSQKLIVAARTIPGDDRVPYAFHRRIMARLAGHTAVDFWEPWGRAFSRAALCSVALMLLLAIGSFLIPSTGPASLSQDVETTLLAAVDNNTEQIGDAR
jgi:hypothetical protein